MWLFLFCLLAALAALIEAAFGYPAIVYRIIGHPVSWMGNLLGVLERHLNKTTFPYLTRKYLGILALCVLLAVSGSGAILLTYLVSSLPFHWLIRFILIALLASTLPAQHSLYIHVIAVADALEHKSLQEARTAVSMIVGRNTQELDEAAVSRAAIESLSENFSDGVVAPLFWCAVSGLPGMALYKAANTADSMIGHKNERYSAFGWAAAKFDDLVNLPCSRLAALWFILAACFTEKASVRGALQAVRRDARHHRSPNAGWPEAAMAGALNFKLGGARIYGNEWVDDATMGHGRFDLNAFDIHKALLLYKRACLCQFITLASLGLLSVL